MATHHRCERFQRRKLPCPMAGVRPFDRSVIPDLQLHDFRSGEGRSSVDRTQEELSPHAFRVAALVALDALKRLGMVGLPDYANGGLAWIQSMIENVSRSGLFDEGAQRPSGLRSVEDLGMFEGRFAREYSRAAELSRPREEGPVNALLESLLPALLLGGGTAAVGGAFVFGNRGRGAATPARGGGGGGKVIPSRAPRLGDVFPQRFTPPSFERMKTGSPFVGQPPSE